MIKQTVRSVLIIFFALASLNAFPQSPNLQVKWLQDEEGGLQINFFEKGEVVQTFPMQIEKNTKFKFLDTSMNAAGEILAVGHAKRQDLLESSPFLTYSGQQSLEAIFFIIFRKNDGHILRKQFLGIEPPRGKNISSVKLHTKPFEQNGEVIIAYSVYLSDQEDKPQEANPFFPFDFEPTIQDDIPVKPLINWTTAVDTIAVFRNDRTVFRLTLPKTTFKGFALGSDKSIAVIGYQTTSRELYPHPQFLMRIPSKTPAEDVRVYFCQMKLDQELGEGASLSYNLETYFDGPRKIPKYRIAGIHPKGNLKFYFSVPQDLSSEGQIIFLDEP